MPSEKKPFEDLNKAFEAKYTMDDEIEFKVMVRGARLFGHWAAEQAGLVGDAVEQFAEAVVDYEIAHHHVAPKVQGDLRALGVEMGLDRLESKFLEMQGVVRVEIERTGIDPANFSVSRRAEWLRNRQE